MELSEVKGIGPKSLKLLEKLNIRTPSDLITYYPYRFEILKTTHLTEPVDDRVIVDAKVDSTPYLSYFKGNQNRISFKAAADGKLINVVLFNRVFLKSNLQPGTELILIGKYEEKKNMLVVTDLYFGALKDTTKIIPIYHVTKGLTNKVVRKYIQAVDSENIPISDFVPDFLDEKYQFVEKRQALDIVHNPTNMDRLNHAIKRLKYEEFLLFMLKINYLKQKNLEEGDKLIRIIDHDKVTSLIASLPFTLTPDQQDAVRDIEQDFKSPKRMNRLIQGDVGSGKTIVSMIAMYMNYLAGYQSALMAPTEILAKQHYETLQSLFQDKEIHVAILLGSTKAKEKKELYHKLETGEIDMIVGTHALIQEKVIYHNLGLVVTDEQQRFGVNQRANLRNKGKRPDVLYLSATPIPRTYALTIYGDMDVSNIKTNIQGRKAIKTELKGTKDIRSVLFKMKEELEKGHQVYVVVPLIEKNETIDLENVEQLEQNLNRAFAGQYRIGVLHGKMSSEKKEQIMKEFQSNQIKILISTTVVEVGIDVKNATMMVIYDAERFGLSQLHQLRGRVGRNELQSYCILISDSEHERLSVMTKTTDGFKISEEDFKLRGEGNLFGVKQSGDMEFNLADIKKDFDILLHAKEDAEQLFSQGINQFPEIEKELIYLETLD